MAKDILVGTHVEVANPAEEPNAKGCVVCVHTTRWLAERELELVRVVTEATLEALFAMMPK
jgi:hypothetical protein